MQKLLRFTQSAYPSFLRQRVLVITSIAKHYLQLVPVGIALVLLLFFFLSCEQTETVRMEEYEVHGIDVSHYQQRIDWSLVAEQDIDFVYIKATEGLEYVDSMFLENWASCGQVEIKRGAYHFFRPSLPVAKQAQNFIQQISLQNGDLIPAIDIEVLDGLHPKDMLVNLKQFIYLIEIEYNVKPLLYTYAKFYNKYLAGHFNDYPKWIARYHRKKPKLANGSPWHFWQYGDRGLIEGIEGKVDFNVFYSSAAHLDSFCIRDNAAFLDLEFPE